MNIQLSAATMFDHTPTKEELLTWAGRNAGICYMAGTMNDLLDEDPAQTLKRARATLQAGHHSVHEHTYVTLTIEGIPKAVAMTLNNERVYTASEKSARYTTMAASEQERRIYTKWQLILLGVIADKMPDLERKKAIKLAKENARLFISVFTPATTMNYTCSLRQINYIAGWIRDLCEQYSSEFGEPECPWPELEPEYAYNGPETDFEYQLVQALKDFYLQLKAIDDLLILELESGAGRGLSLLTKWRRERILELHDRAGFEEDLDFLLDYEEPEQWGMYYSTTYRGSMAQLAQAQRHRTLRYDMSIPDPEGAEFYVPEFLPDNLVEDWLKDMESVKLSYPQGMLVQIHEGGYVDDFVLKCRERLCGAAQLEICAQTWRTLRHYYDACVSNTVDFNPLVAHQLRPLVYTSGCIRSKLFECKCSRPCWAITHGVEIAERFI